MMKTSLYKSTTLLLAAALLWVCPPPSTVRADDTSTGAAITLGLAGAVVVVYALVSLRSDVERYTQADLETTIARAAEKADASPVVLQGITTPHELTSSSGGQQMEVTGAAIGWRVQF